MSKLEMNSKEYWEERFVENWEKFEGIEQTEFFAQIAIELLPEWFIRKLKEKKYSICDMGCALGDGVKVFTENLGYPISGADFSEEAIEKAKVKYKENDFQVIDLRKIPVSVKYDVVFCSNVLEHFYDPWKVVENFTKVANKYIVLLVPFQETMQVEEHVYKFDVNKIFLNIDKFSLVFANSINAADIPGTFYADKQILLLYSIEDSDKRLANLENVMDGVETMNGTALFKLNQKNEEYLNKLIEEHKNNEKQLQEIINLTNEKKQLEIASLKKVNKLDCVIKEKEVYINQVEKESNEKKEKYIEAISKNNQMIQGLEEKVHELENYQQELQNEIYKLHSSFSWRITGFFRFIGKITHFSIIHEKMKHSKTKMKNEYVWSDTVIYRIKKSKLSPLIKKILPYKIKSKLANKYNNALINYHTEIDLETEIQQFIQLIAKEDQVILVYSGVKYIDSEGQRNIRLVHEALKKGIKIIFAYWRWDTNEEIEKSMSGMLQIPIDYLYQNKSRFFQQYLADHKNKAVLIEFPHPSAVEIIDIANCFEWITIYDVIDDWEEFSKKGQAVWYDKKVEIRIANMVDINIATASRLREKISEKIVHKSNYYLISNGVDPNKIKKVKRDLDYDFRKGKVQIGYFGHLTDAWFDWELVKSLAYHNRDWTFHIIGYGQPENLKLPENVILYGKKKPSELPKYAAFWDVAIIPFINCELTLSVNPIKIYEYLQLGLPVVTSNMPEVKQFPYTKIAIGEEEFKNAIKDFVGMKLEEEIVNKFILSNTWEEKLNALLKCIKKFAPLETYKQIYKGGKI